MKQRYVVLGTRRYNDTVRLFLRRDDMVQSKKENDIFSSILSNPEGYINQMKEDAILTQQPDTITISYEDWKKNEYKVDDVIFIDIEPFDENDFSGE